MRFRELKLKKDPDCPVCGTHPTVTKLIDYEQFCGIHPAAPEPTINDCELFKPKVLGIFPRNITGGVAYDLCDAETDDVLADAREEVSSNKALVGFLANLQKSGFAVHRRHRGGHTRARGAVCPHWGMGT